MSDIHSYHWITKQLHSFFKEKNMIEITSHGENSLLKSILTNDSYIATFNLNGSVHMLPQTYQHILQSKLTDSPDVKGMYIIYNKYINTGIFPSIDFICKQTDKYELVEELLEFFQYNINIYDIKINCKDNMELVDKFVNCERTAENRLIISTPKKNSTLWTNKELENDMVDEDHLYLNNKYILSIYKNESDSDKVKQQFNDHTNLAQFDRHQISYEISQYILKKVPSYVGGCININNFIKSLDESYLLFKEKTTTTDGSTQTVKKQRVRCWTLPGDEMSNKTVRSVSAGLSMAMEKGLDAIL